MRAGRQSLRPHCYGLPRMFNPQHFLLASWTVCFEGDAIFYRVVREKKKVYQKHPRFTSLVFGVFKRRSVANRFHIHRATSWFLRWGQSGRFHQISITQAFRVRDFP